MRNVTEADLSTGPGQNSVTSRRKLILGLGLRLIGPYLLYSVLRSRLHDELEALAIAAAIPLAIGAVIALRRRRIDWALVLSALSLLLSLGIAATIGHGTKVVELRGAVAPTVLGALLLVLALGSAPLRRRVLLAIRDKARPGRVAGNSAAADPGLAAPHLPPAAVRRLRMLLSLWGVGLLVVAAAHVVIVFTASTSAFLVESRASILGLLGILIVVTRLAGLNNLTPADEADQAPSARSSP